MQICETWHQKNIVENPEDFAIVLLSFQDNLRFPIGEEVEWGEWFCTKFRLAYKEN